MGRTARSVTGLMTYIRMPAMKIERETFWLFGVLTATTLATLAPVILFAADDGPLFQRNLSDTPGLHTEYASIGVMPLYVRAQNSLGELIEIEYLTGHCLYSDPDGCEVAATRDEAKPLIATYLDGEVTFIDGLKFTGHGRRDAYAAYSLDDGGTWKDTNLSESGELSSFRLADRTDYPGDVFGISSAVVGNRVFVAWASRYCEGGSPLYSWEDEDKDAFLAFTGLDHPVVVDGEAEPYQLYTDDLFGVTGTQGSSDFADEGYPEVGEVPYACLWTARGTLEQDTDTGLYDIAWRKAERVTSGVRDVNLVQVAGTGGAGFVVTWQEDPDGLRPGKALCPDGGFNGAVAHQGTDIWYSYVAWDHFDEFALETQPKIAVPMAMPVRISDNNVCRANVAVDNQGYAPYCYADFNGSGTADLCAESVSWTNPGGTTFDVCVAEDGRVMTGRTAATRPHFNLHPYTTADDTTSAWMILAHERNKAMGSELDEDEEPIDIGKDVWYRTFEMSAPEVVAQGMMLNQPALDHETEDYFPVYVDERGYEYRETEISRHASLLTQGLGKTMAAPNHLAAMVLFVQGVIEQGGPADVMARRVVLPDGFDSTVDNPFAYENVQCVEIADDGTSTLVDMLYPDGVNPNYVRGLCPGTPFNLSGTTIVECDDGSIGEDCAASFPWEPDEGDGYPKVIEWVQAEDNFNDPSWVNPYDVAGAPGGYVDGDFVLVQYPLAPNWKASTIGNEAFNMYARRSFDGGQTWTTLPASYTDLNGTTWTTGDGTESCEWYGWGGQDEYEVCTTYGAGEFEQARNLSQLTGSKVTMIDPRYSPTGGTRQTDYSALLCDDDGDGDWVNCGYTEAPYLEEIRDPSVFFAAYGTADNTTLPESDVEPISIYYSRATAFGDDYDFVEYTTNSGQLFVRWDWLAQGKRIRPSDADLTATPSGDRLYAVWSQEDYDRRGDLIGVDAWWRRVFYDLDPEE